jgi:hypothetical protein
MDFNFSEDQIMVRDLARGILEKEVTPERVKAVSAQPDWCDHALWATLAEAGLLGLVVPGEFGGMGFGIQEACVLLQEIGRVVAPVPALPTMVLGGMPIAQFGSEAQKREWLEPMAAGKVILTGAPVDAGSADPSKPATTARQDGGGWRLDGQKSEVRAAHLAQRIVVPAATGAGVGIFLLDPQSSGVTLTRQRTTTGEPLFSVALSGARVDQRDLLSGEARDGTNANWMYECAVIATCAMQVGVSEKTVEITASYVTERVQFGVPIGSFQAVQHRMADCYIDREAMRWVTWRAAFKLAQGVPAPRDAAVAKFWAAEAGARIAAAAQHLHGGIGVDIDYPLHRYFLWSKALELSLGAAAPHLARLGRDMARTGPRELP